MKQNTAHILLCVVLSYKLVLVEQQEADSTVTSINYDSDTTVAYSDVNSDSDSDATFVYDQMTSSDEELFAWKGKHVNNLVIQQHWQ